MTTVTNKNGIEFDIDAIATDLNSKMDRDGLNATASVCVESYQNGSSWYRVYSDGWCEQGGEYQTETDGVVTVNLLKSFINSNYNLLKTYGMEANSYSYYSATAQLYCNWNKTTSSFSTWGKQNGAFNEFSWRASGYIR